MFDICDFFLHWLLVSILLSNHSSQCIYLLECLVCKIGLLYFLSLMVHNGLHDFS